MPVIDRSLSLSLSLSLIAGTQLTWMAAELAAEGFVQPKMCEVSFQWKNPGFLLKNPDLLIRNLDFLLNNVDLH